MHWLPRQVLLASLSTLALCLQAQQVEALKGRALSTWGIGTAQFSGITALGDDRYALVSDKEPTDGFYLMRLRQDGITGQLTGALLEGFRGNRQPAVNAAGLSTRDCEGIAYFPAAGTVFISGEGDQAILEYDLDGQPTGRKLAVPAQFATSRIVPNYGFEALTYDAAHRRFWTTTESTLPADGAAASPSQPTAVNRLRLQAFDEDLLPREQYAYLMDRGMSEGFGRNYALGVSALLALPDGRLLVLEREVHVASRLIGSRCRCKLFLIDPAAAQPIDAATPLSLLGEEHFLPKTLLLDFTTYARPGRFNFANYEGMCLGRRLHDGRQTLLLVADSQGGYGKAPFQLKDYVRVLIIDGI